MATPLLDLPPRPDFATKAGGVLDLYQRLFAGQALGGVEYVLSADEKTSVQARCHPTLPPAATRDAHRAKAASALPQARRRTGSRAQVRQRRDRLGTQQRVAELEQRIGAAGKQACSSVRNAPSRTRGKVGIGMAAQPDRTEHRQAS